MACNICGSQEFLEYRGRPAERCASCGSKARHRVAHALYQRLFADKSMPANSRALHMAPEKCLVAGLQAIFGAGYITADASPERYPHEQCLKLFFPNDYDIFPDQYFDVILHNHVLEHIPGSYKDHLPEFARILKPGGTMVLSIPGPYLDLDTKEGGEHFEDDKQRLKQFLQEDHFKVFGRDFEPFLASMAGGTLISDGIDDELRQSISVRPGKAPFFVWQKDR